MSSSRRRRSSGRSTEIRMVGIPRPQRARKQAGQAIVLIALMLTVLIGMAAIAIDGSRAYALRRDMQAAVDSASLAAGDKLQQTGSWSAAETAATNIFGDRKSTRLNSSHVAISYAVFCLKKKKKKE